MGKDFEIILQPGTDRAEDFMQVFGRLEFKVKSPIFSWAMFPGFDDPQPFFELDFNFISQDEKRKLIKHLARKFNLPEFLVELDIDRVGVPILDRDCYLVILNPHRWL